MLTDEEIDRHLDAILRASGSALRYYSMNTTKEKMRKALRGAIEAAHAALSGAQSQWMPIETAPAGDSVILCTTGGHVGGGVCSRALRLPMALGRYSANAPRQPQAAWLDAYARRIA